MAAAMNQYLRSVMQESGYTQAGLARNDVTNVTSHYSDLKPRPEMFMFNDGKRKKLVCLSGTIPVTYKGSRYNIPVAIWVMDNHPQSAPMCFVKPTPTMQVRQGRHVDASGRVYLPYLNEWRQGTHDLTGLVQVMTIVFGEEPPVVSRQTNTMPPQRPPYPAVSPYPAATPGYPPQGPPANSYHPTNPPYPVGLSSQPPYPHAATASYPTPNTGSYPPYPPVASYPPTMNTAQPGPLAFPANQAATNRISDDMMKASLKSAVNDKLKRRMKDAHAQADSEMSTLRQTEKELKDGQAKLSEIINKLESETAQVNQNIDVLKSKNQEIEEKIIAMQSKQEQMDVDEVVLPTTPLYKQIVEAFAEEQALEDTIYYLGEGLRKGSVDLDAFLKHVRALSRQQFVLRATIKKARATAGLADIY